MSRLLVAGALLGLALIGPASATRILHQPEDAYELALGNVTLPNYVGDLISFRLCADCETLSLRVGADTRYFLSGQQIALADLLEAASRLKPTVCVGLFFDKQSHMVNRVAVD